MFCGECGKKKMIQIKDRKCKKPCHQCFYYRKKRIFYATPEKVQAMKAEWAELAELAELAQERQLKLTSSSDTAKPNKKLCVTKTVETTMKEPTRTREKLGHSFYPHKYWRCDCCTSSNDESEETVHYVYVRLDR